MESTKVDHSNKDVLTLNTIKTDFNQITYKPKATSSFLWRLLIKSHDTIPFYFVRQAKAINDAQVRRAYDASQIKRKI